MVKFKELRRALQKPKKIDEFEDEEDELGKPRAKKWYEDVPDDPESFNPLLEGDVIQLKDEARVVLENDTLHFKNKSASGQNQSHNDWLKTMITKGTMQDRIAASVVVIQNSPLHALGTISSLIGQVKTSKKHCVKLMEVLTDLFIKDLLLPDKKLRPFEKRPLSLLNDLSNGVLKKRKYFLSLWYFEDQLKIEYRNFIQAILEVGRDTLVSNRDKSIIAMQKLLVGNPEQESTLLASLVNKIGDPIPAVASKACMHLKIVLKEHPNMKTIVMEELERLLFRPNISQRAQYYTICFLARYEFTSDDEELATRFIRLYFAFFKACVKKGDVDSRMMSVLLEGVKRAFPFAKKDSLTIKDHVDTLYKIVHIAHFKVALLSLCLLLQISDYNVAISDRFYSNLYQFILHPGLHTSAQHAMFVSLIFRAMSKDIQFNRIKVFIKRLLQVCHYAPVQLACGILIMISHMFRKFPNVKSLALVATEFNEEEDDKSDEEHYEDAPPQEEDDELNMDNKEEALVKNKDVICEEKPEEKKPHISSWHHVSHTNKGSQSSNKEICRVNVRNPLYLANEINVYTELVSLSSHFHPTVSLFANHLLKDTFIAYAGNPLLDFTLSRFLDRWVFKNPKKINKDNLTKFCRSSTYRPHGVRNLPVNSEEYLKVAESSIPSDELFLYRFLKEQREGKFIRKKDDDEQSEVSSVGSEEFEGIMDQLVGGKEVFDFDEGMKAPSESDKKKKGDSDDDSSGSEEEEKDENEGEEEDDDFDSDADASDDEKADEHGDDDIDTKEEEDEDEDDEMDYEKVKEEFSDLDDIDEDEEVMSFDGDSDEDFTFTMSDVETDDVNFKSKTKKFSKENQSNRKNADNSVFAPAEEFAQMLEDTGDQFARYGSLANISNKDNAGMKQLKWEMKRNQWIRGQNKGKRKGGGMFSNKPRKKFKK